MKPLPQYFDHTILRADARRADITRFCDEALAWQFASVCVNPVHVRFVANRLRGSGVRTCAVVGFPLGASRTQTKAFEAQLAVDDGAEEVDMVINIGALLDGDIQVVEDDIAAVVRAAHPRALVKVIIETSALDDQAKRAACEAAVRAGADFVKTSTGFGTGGATVEDVRLMREVVGDRAAVKASTGINTREILDAMIAAGAERLGTSKGPIILGESPAAGVVGSTDAY